MPIFHAVPFRYITTFAILWGTHQAWMFGRSRIAGSELFEDTWQRYPNRHVSQNKRDCLRQWMARVREGCDEMEMLRGAIRYKEYCDKLRLTGTEYVMQPCRFFGTSRHFELDWRINGHAVVAREELSTRVIHKLKQNEAEALPRDEASVMLQQIREGLNRKAV